MHISAPGITFADYRDIDVYNKDHESIDTQWNNLQILALMFFIACMGVYQLPKFKKPTSLKIAAKTIRISSSFALLFNNS